MTAPSDLHDRPELGVVLIYIGFYVFFYLPRGAVQ